MECFDMDGILAQSCDVISFMVMKSTMEHYRTGRVCFVDGKFRKKW